MFEKNMLCNIASSGNYEILDAAKNGDIHRVYELYKIGLYPKNAILIGMPLEISPNGSIGEGARQYFRNLPNTNIAKKSNKVVLPIPLNSFYLDIIGNFNDESQKRYKLKKLVREDLRKLDGIVIPGDHFNFPPIKDNKDPYEAIFEYEGKKDFHNETTIYSLNDKNLTGKEFYKVYPEHKLNPNAQSLHYEAELVNQLKNTDKPVMCSCHGIQMFAIMHGAKMIAGVMGHNEKKPMPTIIMPNSMALGYLGDIDKTSLHIHKLALSSKMPRGLKVVGHSNNIVEVVEETTPNKPPSFLFQCHPEFVKNHPAMESFVMSVIQHNLKKQSEILIINNSIVRKNVNNIKTSQKQTKSSPLTLE